MAVDMFLKIADIGGESQDSSHKGEIDVYSWSLGWSQSGSMQQGGGGGSGKVSITDLTVTKPMDKSSPVLMLACSKGSQYGEAKLTVRKAGGDAPLEYVIITLNDVIITALSSGGSGGGDQIMETLSLNCRTLHVEYQPQKQDGTADGGSIKYDWDINANAVP